MIYALGSGYPVAFALPGAAIVSIVLAGLTDALLEGDSSAYFIQDGPIEWLTAGVTNFRGIYWEVERDTLIAIPLFIFMGIMLQRSKIAETCYYYGSTVWPNSRWIRYFSRICWRSVGCHDRNCWSNCSCNGSYFFAGHVA